MGFVRLYSHQEQDEFTKEESMVKPRQLGHLVLRVRDLEASEKWYSEVLGLHTTNKRPGQMIFMSARDDSSHELALVSVGEDAPGPEETRVGLYHFAWEMESFEGPEGFIRAHEGKGRQHRRNRRPWRVDWCVPV